MYILQSGFRLKCVFTSRIAFSHFSLNVVPWYTTVSEKNVRTEALASVKFYQIMSIFIFFIRLIILEDFIRLISYNGPCVRLGCSFFLATALVFRLIL